MLGEEKFINFSVNLHFLVVRVEVVAFVETSVYGILIDSSNVTDSDGVVPNGDSSSEVERY